MNNKSKLKLSLYLNYFVFAILLNSVGIVILKSKQEYGVDEVAASTLELFKDISIAIVSFLIASFLPRIGYKNSMLIGLFTVTIGSIIMYYGNSFNTARLLFSLVGISFALIKVSVYSMIGMITNNEKEHGALMSSIEGVFMLGIALAYFLFPFFNDDTVKGSWLNVYWLLAFLSLVSFFFLYLTPVEESKILINNQLIDDAKQMFSLITSSLVAVFVLSAFLFVMVEQGIMTWLPTFNNEVLKLSTNLSIMMASILAVSSGIGRIGAGYFTLKFSWFKVVLFCLISAMLLVFFILPKTVNYSNQNIISFIDIPLIAFVFPLVGLFIAPVYPLLNSSVLSALPQRLHSPMTGLIVIFSALGGTIGSRIVGYLFRDFGPENGFYFTLLPMLILLICLFKLKKLTYRSLSQ
jgi:MFS transporter, FHS family, glucose/mannose:H+ symporter